MLISSNRVPGIQPNSGHRDYSRLRCGVGETQLGPSARISAGVLTRTLVAAGYSGHTGSRDSGRHRKADERRSGAAHPNRFAGFAAAALQGVRAAGDKLERAVSQLGFKGAMINGYSNIGDMDTAQY